MRVEHELVVNRPVAEVFAYLTDVKNVPEWQTSVIETRLDFEGAVRRGARFGETRTFGGRQVSSTLEVTEHEPDRRFSVRVVSGPVPLEVRHSLEPSDGGTRIRIVGEGEPGGLFKLAGRLVAAQAKRQLETDFARLKRLLEARS